MSFKHDDGRNSALYKSLEKIAYEKGLIKEEPIQKKASYVKKSYAAGDFLDENIVKLCDGLREKGMISQASDLEKNFLLYKMAKSSAPKDVDPEVIQDAHPNGGTRVSTIHEEAYVEDILETHLKMLQVSLEDVKPRKLASSKDILKAIKIALAAPTADEQVAVWNKPLTDSLRSIYKEIIDLFIYCAKLGTSNLGVDATNEVLQGCAALLEMLKDPSTNYNKTKPRYDAIRKRLEYKFWSPSLSVDQTNNVFFPRLFPLENKFQVEMWKDLAGKDPLINQMAVSKNDPTDENATLFNNETELAEKRLAKWKSYLEKSSDFEESESKAGIDWITAKQNKITKLKDRFKLITDPAEKKELSKGYLNSLRAITWKAPNDFETFRKTFGLKNEL